MFRLVQGPIPSLPDRRARAAQDSRVERVLAAERVPRVAPGMRRTLSGLALSSVLCALSTAPPARADYEEIVVNDDMVGEENRIDPVAVRLADGRYAAFWSDNGRGHTDVLGRIFDESWNPLAPAYRVNTDDGLFAHRNLDVGDPGGGVFLLVWEDGRVGGGSVGIYGRLCSAESGDPLSDDFRIDGELGFGADVQPRVHTSPDGESLVVWVGRVNQTNRILARRVSADGSLGTDFLPATENPSHTQGGPSVTRLPDGRWVLAWAEEDTNRDWNVFYRFLAADGTPEGPATRANTDLFGSGIQWQPDLDVLGSRILLVWNDARVGAFDAWARWIGFDGAPDGTDFSLRSASDSASDERPRIHRGSAGSFAVSFFGGLEDRQRAMVRYFAADGTPVADERLIDDLTAGVLHRRPWIVSAGDASWWELWTDDRSGTWNVFVQSYEPSTGTEGDESEIYSAPLSASQLFPDVALFPDGGAVVVWADLQLGSIAIYARLLDENGLPAGESFRVSSIPPNVDITTLDSSEAIRDFAPHVAAGANGFVVTWAINQLGERLNYYGQFYDRQGNPIGGDFPIAPGEEESPQRDARPAMLQSGGFAIVYQMTQSSGGSGADVFLQLYGPDGQPSRSVIRVPEGSLAADQVSPSIAVSPFDEVFVSWIDRRAGGWDVMGQRFSPSGDRIGTNVFQHPPDEPTSDQLNTTVGVASDRTVTVWETRPLTAGFIEARLEIFESLQAGAGASMQAGAASEPVIFRVNPGKETRGIKRPRVAMSRDGRFLITWWDNADGQTQLLAQRFGLQGEPIGEPYPVHGNGTEGSRLDAAVSVDNERVQYVWSDSRRARGWDVRSRRVDWNFSGAPTPVLLRAAEAEAGPQGVALRWETFFELSFQGFLVHRQAAGEVSSEGLREDAVRLTPDPIPSSPDGAYSFLDRSAPEGERVEYFLEALDQDGRSELFGPIAADVGVWRTAAAWPHPFRQSVELDLTNGGARGGSGHPPALDVFDASGRRVRTLRAGQGEDSIVWDGNDDGGDPVPTGVYFVRPVGSVGSAVRIVRLR